VDWTSPSSCDGRDAGALGETRERLENVEASFSCNVDADGSSGASTLRANIALVAFLLTVSGENATSIKALIPSEGLGDRKLRIAIGLVQNARLLLGLDPMSSTLWFGVLQLTAAKIGR
jgi:hypothetical protein